MSVTETVQGLPRHWQLLRPRRGSARRDRAITLDASFLAGQDAGARTSACVARLAAFDLMGGARWWNRWRRRLMARALVACAEELEDAVGPGAPAAGTGVPAATGQNLR